MKVTTISEFVVWNEQDFSLGTFVRRMLLLTLGLVALPTTSVFADYVDANNETYQPLDYITSTGSQWIVTDIRPTSTDTVKMKFRLFETKTQALYCSRTTMTSNTFTAFYIENVVRCDRNTDTSAKGKTTPSFVADTVLVADYATRKFSVNGMDQEALMAVGDYTPGSVLMLFASHKKGDELSVAIVPDDVANRATYRLYYYELYASGCETPKHRLMPARRKSDSVVGLYDTIGRKFYGPADYSSDFVASPSITDVTAQQRYPWNGKVDISYTLSSDIEAEAKQKAFLTSLRVTATDEIANETYTATMLNGDTALTAGTHKLVWDLDAEGVSFKSSNVVFNVSCETTPATYCVIDLSAGANASSYPITYLDSPPSGGFNVNAYKTSKLVLRRIEPSSFNMCETTSVTLVKPYFVGIFEMTQKQYELVMGNNPSFYNNASYYATRPVEKVSYDTIRGSSNGSKWPSSNMVDSSSFIGKLRARTKLDFDLPTEAQWEYACRAGTTTHYNNGRNYAQTTQDPAMDEVGRYYYNFPSGNRSYSADSDLSAGTAAVGSYLPNTWGLYDMHGNVREWCLDWYGTLSDGIEPQGVSSGIKRVIRGGCWFDSAEVCTSSKRMADSSSNSYNGLGFRLVRTLSNDYGSVWTGASESDAVDLSSGMRTASCTEYIHYSTLWAESAGVNSVAVVEVNGEPLSSTVGSGCINWMPVQNGTYTLTHKVMSGGEQIGETLTATFLVDFILDPVVIEPNGAEFENSSQMVSLSCATEGITILYTTDGSDPKMNGFEYTKPFNIYESCTVRAIAVKYGRKDSDEITAVFTRTECLSEAVNLYGNLMETNENPPWTVVTDVSHDGVSCVRSGAIGHGGTTWLQTSMRKAGMISFWWKAACEEAEEEDGETYWYDYGSFLVDGVEKAKIAGNDTGWRKVEVDVPTGGKHVLRWEYHKDGATSYSPDCIWLDQVQWIPADGSGYTLTTPDPVPYSWLSGYGLGLDSDFESAAKQSFGKTDSNGRAMQVWQDYVAGTDPTNTMDFLRAVISFSNGMPKVSWTPNLNSNAEMRVYTVLGKTNLTDVAWMCPTNSGHRFFKVKVALP